MYIIYYCLIVHLFIYGNWIALYVTTISLVRSALRPSSERRCLCVNTFLGIVRQYYCFWILLGAHEQIYGPYDNTTHYMWGCVRCFYFILYYFYFHFISLDWLLYGKAYLKLAETFSHRFHIIFSIVQRCCYGCCCCWFFIRVTRVDTHTVQSIQCTQLECAHQILTLEICILFSHRVLTVVDVFILPVSDFFLSLYSSPALISIFFWFVDSFSFCQYSTELIAFEWLYNIRYAAENTRKDAATFLICDMICNNVLNVRQINKF